MVVAVVVGVVAVVSDPSFVLLLQPVVLVVDWRSIHSHGLAYFYSVVAAVTVVEVDVAAAVDTR